MALTYGMIGDRLSDLVAELIELSLIDTDWSSTFLEVKTVIDSLDSIRAECDAKSLSGLTDAIAARDGI
jgi:hypothetical protein